MARVKIEGVLDNLSSEVRKALREAVRETAPGITIDEHALARAFSRAMHRACSTWEYVPDHCVETD